MFVMMLILVGVRCGWKAAAVVCFPRMGGQAVASLSSLGRR
jgi:hypothetical protein